MAAIHGNNRIFRPVNFFIAREILTLRPYAWKPNTAWVDDKCLIVATQHLHMCMPTSHDPRLITRKQISDLRSGRGRGNHLRIGSGRSMVAQLCLFMVKWKLRKWLKRA